MYALILAVLDRLSEALERMQWQLKKRLSEMTNDVEFVRLDKWLWSIESLNTCG